MQRGCMVAPGVVGVGQHLFAALSVDGNNIALQILLKIEGVKDIGGVAARSVLHTDGRTAFIIEIDQETIEPRLADDLRAVQELPYPVIL